MRWTERLIGKQGREILALAVPALATLLAEPLFLLADSAIVGHLGPLNLAGLAIGSAVLSSVVGLAVFLAYGTTAATARQLGAGHRREAMAQGMDGLWLGLLLGTVISVVLALAAHPVVAALGASDAVRPFAVAYLRTSLLGLPAMLIVLAATGVLRGLQDTRTPLIVATAGALLNAVLNWVLVYPLGLGIAGSGLGTSISQLLMGIALGAAVVVSARREGASCRPHWRGIVLAARTGVPLVVRSAAMRVTLLVTASAAALLGDVELAAHQVVFTVWTTAAFALDALAIAAQALTGRDLGAGDTARVRDTTRLMVRWGVGFGVLVGAVFIALSPWLGLGFTSDEAVRHAIMVALIPAALAMPLAGYVFVVDGVLIGAGDGRYLGLTAIVNTLTYLPLVGLVVWVGPGGVIGFALLWVAFAFGWMGSRGLTLANRARRDHWLITGA